MFGVSVRMWRQGVGNLSSAQNKEGINTSRYSDKVVAKQDRAQIRNLIEDWWEHTKEAKVDVSNEQ